MPVHKMTQPIQIPVPLEILEAWEQMSTAPYLKGFNMGDIRIVLEWFPNKGYHIIYTGKDRYPTWAEMSAFRHLMLDENKHVMVMILPQIASFTEDDTQLDVWEMGADAKANFEKPEDYKETIEDLKIQLKVHRG